MAPVERRAWADTLTVSTHGLRLAFRASRRGVLPQVLPLLPPGWKAVAGRRVDRAYAIVDPAPSGRGEAAATEIHADGALLARAPGLREALVALESDLDLTIAERAPKRVFVHAGVVGWRGRAILLPGRSLAGKTTLTAALVRAGAEYYSDEFAVLDAAGRVHPFARPPAIRREGTRGPGEKRDVSALGGAVGRRPLPVGLVVVSRYRRGAAWRPRRLSPGRGALALLANTIAARRAPERALPVLGLVAARAPVLEGWRGEAESVIASLLDQVAGATRRSTVEGS